MQNVSWLTWQSQNHWKALHVLLFLCAEALTIVLLDKPDHHVFREWKVGEARCHVRTTAHHISVLLQDAKQSQL